MGMSNDGSALFRSEALKSARQRLWGEMLLRSPRIARVAIPLLVLGFILLGALLSRASFVRSESVHGYISPQGGWVRVFAEQGGRVLEVMVEEGERVAENQVLARLVNRRAIGEALYSETEYAQETRAQIALLESEIANESGRQRRETAWFALESSSLVRRQTVLSQLAEVAGEQGRLRADAFARGEALARAGALPEADLQMLRSEYLSARADSLNVSHALLDLESQLEKHRVDEAALPTAHFARLSNLSRELSKLKQQLTDLQGASDYYVTAPVPGRVRGVTYVEGDQVKRDRPLFSILEEDAGVRAILLVPSRAIGFVREGQRVKLRYDAYPYQKFGSHDGEITEVSRTSFSAGELSVPFSVAGPVYRVYVRPTEAEILAAGEMWALLPGMVLQAEIQLESRSLWQWLTAPLRSLDRS